MITKEDVIRVAKDIQISPTDKIVEKIIEEYPDWEISDPTSTWDLIVENMLYNYL